MERYTLGQLADTGVLEGEEYFTRRIFNVSLIIFGDGVRTIRTAMKPVGCGATATFAINNH